MKKVDNDSNNIPNSTTIVFDRYDIDHLMDVIQYIVALGEDCSIEYLKLCKFIYSHKFKESDIFVIDYSLYTFIKRQLVTYEQMKNYK